MNDKIMCNHPGCGFIGKNQHSVNVHKYRKHTAAGKRHRVPKVIGKRNESPVNRDAMAEEPRKARGPYKKHGTKEVPAKMISFCPCCGTNLKIVQAALALAI